MSADNIIKEDWERQWTMLRDARCVQHDTGLIVHIYENDAGECCARAVNSDAWMLGQPARNEALPALLLQAEVVFEAAVQEPKPRKPFDGE
ncbi:MAG TPA: hypothetical protein VK335_07915 [Bryobacteraceae bacterium]|nr:hypothetical protein [Bryobacteraceae bacterium]